MTHRLAQQFHPQKIILFGSYARGTAGPHSDVDLLVIMAISGSKRQTTVEMYRLLGGIGLPKDIILVTPEEVKKYKNIPGTIIHEALNEGKVLYEHVG
ncbi:MAG: nucleotidyltransferase domain-containing protein [Deltaproteobacteria bacterium]|nr:MAG: nucleotidyltransferase domain-containing protein [Deltaproteobacteria bacterium]